MYKYIAIEQRYFTKIGSRLVGNLLLPRSTSKFVFSINREEKLSVILDYFRTYLRFITRFLEKATVVQTNRESGGIHYVQYTSIHTLTAVTIVWTHALFIYFLELMEKGKNAG